MVFHTPNWEDFVQVTFSEIRLYGAENFQIARRLRAMIEKLRRRCRSIAALPSTRSSNCSIALSRSTMRYRQTWRLPVFPIRRGSEDRPRRQHAAACTSPFAEGGYYDPVEQGYHPRARHQEVAQDDEFIRVARRGRQAEPVQILAPWRPHTTLLQEIDAVDGVDSVAAGQVQARTHSICGQCRVQRYRHLDQCSAISWPAYDLRSMHSFQPVRADLDHDQRAVHDTPQIPLGHDSHIFGGFQMDIDRR